VSATASLSNLSLDLKNKKDEFNFTINRANASMYGDLIVEYIQDKKAIKIGEMNGVAVYTILKKEKLQSKLTLKISV
jgi:hypothetical protein